MPIRIMNSANLNNKDIMNNVGIFNDSVAISNNLRESYWDKHCLCKYSWDEQEIMRIVLGV